MEAMIHALMALAATSRTTYAPRRWAGSRSRADRKHPTVEQLQAVVDKATTP
jgi:hypothetical protein